MFPFPFSKGSRGIPQPIWLYITTSFSFFSSPAFFLSIKRQCEGKSPKNHVFQYQSNPSNFFQNPRKSRIKWHFLSEYTAKRKSFPLYVDFLFPVICQSWQRNAKSSRKIFALNFQNVECKSGNPAKNSFVKVPKKQNICKNVSLNSPLDTKNAILTTTSRTIFPRRFSARLPIVSFRTLVNSRFSLPTCHLTSLV